MVKTIDVKLVYEKYDNWKILIDDLDADSIKALKEFTDGLAPMNRRILGMQVKTDNIEVKRFLSHMTAKVIKNTESEEYGNIYEVDLPVRFFFSKDGLFSGIKIDVRDFPYEDHILAEELTKRLSKALSQQKNRS